MANYIFGGNQQKQKIVMTAPVIMNMSDTEASMSFVMPSQYQLSDLPSPNSAAVSLVSQDSMKLAVLRFGGFSSDEKIAKHAQLLTQVLEKNNIRTKGSLLYMGYNAPWDVINRRNEVAFRLIDWWANSIFLIFSTLSWKFNSIHLHPIFIVL